MRHIGTQELKTKDLILRRYRLEDAAPMYRAWCTDEEVTRYLRWTPHQNLRETENLVSIWVNGYSEDDFYQWAVTLHDGMLIGCIGLVKSEEFPAIYEPGYCYGKAFWGKGYATQALQAVVEFVFTKAQFPKLVCCHAVQNPSSGAVMKKVGFVPTHLSEYHKFDGTPIVCQCYELTKENYDRTTH